MNNIIVQKYGGTSMGDAKRIKNVANRIVKYKNKGNKMVVVVSAMGNTTNSLIEKAKEINTSPSSREMDMLLSTGEQISIALLAMAIESLGEKVVSLTGAMSGIYTDQNHKKARINRIDPSRIFNELKSDKIVIVAGFQGITFDGNITTLGRGGSDTSSVAIAAATNAKLCEIYTDVDGVYSSDPRKVPKAQKMKEISYDEMLELAKLGASVLHPRSVELARRHNVPLVVKSSFNDNEGTKIIEVNTNMEKVLIRGVTIDKNIARITVANVPDKPGVAFKLFKKLADNNINIDMIIQNLNHENSNDISYTLSLEDLENGKEISNEFCKEIEGGKVLIKDNVNKLSIVGTGIAGSAEVASKLFGTLYELGINIEMISTSEIKISCIIEDNMSDNAMQKVHSAFKLDKLEMSN
ncbi:aspartate kinase [Helicovermis profundi]|uniref:Aspartokinase n=1 Tax=Helicovermis profundi TaxID=3065157 RepID=A0AAU9E2X2_9FIRM|nr:aspartate kinase [Clostridia bacterium S502]